MEYLGDESGRESCRWCSYSGSLLLNWWKDHVFVDSVILLLHHGEPPAGSTQRPNKE